MSFLKTIGVQHHTKKKPEQILTQIELVLFQARIQNFFPGGVEPFQKTKPNI